MKTIICTFIMMFCLFPYHASASQTRNLYLEFSYEESDVADKEVIGFRLYMSGKQVCQTTSYNSQSFECQFQSGNGKFDFTLAAYFSDNSVGPHSDPYQLIIGTGGSTTNPAQLQGVMTSITSLLLDKKKG